MDRAGFNDCQNISNPDTTTIALFICLQANTPVTTFAGMVNKVVPVTKFVEPGALQLCSEVSSK